MPKARKHQIALKPPPTITASHAVCAARFCAVLIPQLANVLNIAASGWKIGF